MKKHVEQVLEKLYRRKVSLKALILCRFAFGFATFFQYSRMIGYYQSAFGPDGFFGSRFFANVQFEPVLTKSFANTTPLLDGVASSATITILFYTLLISSLAFAFGFRARVFGVVTLVIHSLLYDHASTAYWGAAPVLKPFIFYLLLWPEVSKYYSIDHWLKNRKWQLVPGEEVRGPVFYLRFLQVHLITIYLVAAWSRVEDPNWLDGSALYGMMTNSLYARWNIDWRPVGGILTVFCYGAWLAELTAPAALLFRPSRAYCALVLIFMHLGIESTALVGYWNFLTIPTLFTFFYGSRFQGSLDYIFPDSTGKSFSR